MKTTKLYNSQDYYYETENGLWEYDDILNTMNWDYVVNELREYTPFVVLGNAGLWNGAKDMIPTLYYDADEFISQRLSGYDELEVEKQEHYNNVMFIIRGHHHDGTNYYELWPLEYQSRSKLLELIDIIITIESENSRSRTYSDIREQLNEYTIEEYGHKYTALDKELLIDAVEYLVSSII